MKEDDAPLETCGNCGDDAPDWDMTPTREDEEGPVVYWCSGCIDGAINNQVDEGSYGLSAAQRNPGMAGRS